jgi:hypothetical protein
VLLALFFLPAIAVVAFMLVRRPVRVLAEETPRAATVSGLVDPVTTLDALLAELEDSTLGDRTAAQLEQLADKLEAAADGLKSVG